jgi:hypothetical protein
LLLSGEKVTQKHFHTAAPLWRQYESAFARSRGFFSINLCFTIYNFFINRPYRPKSKFSGGSS